VVLGGGADGVHAGEQIIQLLAELAGAGHGERLIAQQAHFKPVVLPIADAGYQGYANIIATSQRLIAENEQGRNQSTGEIRNEIRVLTRTLAAMSDGAR